MLKSRKAVSPVIATIIIVAIAISIAIAVAYWMIGITGAFTRFEKIEIVSGYAEYDTNKARYDVKLRLKNTGTSDASINIIFINGKPLQKYADLTALHVYSVGWDNKTLGAGEELDIKMPVGTTLDITIELIPSDTGGVYFTGGQSVEITMHTASGKDYPKNIVLP